MAAVLTVTPAMLSAQRTAPVANKPAEAPRPSLPADEGAQAVMNAFSACVVRRSPKIADQFITLVPGTPEEFKLANRISSSYCLDGGELRFKPTLLRAGIYEAMYRRDFGQTAPEGIGTRAVVSYRPSAPLTPPNQLSTALLQFADCVARDNPASTRGLILSEVWTPQENAAFNALRSSMSVCLPKGETLKFTRIVLRGYLAEALYSLSKAPMASAVATGR